MWVLTENNVIINTDHVHCNMVDNAIAVELTTLVRRAIHRAKEVSTSKQKNKLMKKESAKYAAKS